MECLVKYYLWKENFRKIMFLKFSKILLHTLVKSSWGSHSLLINFVVILWISCMLSRNSCIAYSNNYYFLNLKQRKLPFLSNKTYFNLNLGSTATFAYNKKDSERHCKSWHNSKSAVWKLFYSVRYLDQVNFVIKNTKKKNNTRTT